MVNSVIDLPALTQLQELMGDDFAELVQVFVQDAEKRIEQIKQAITVEDSALVADLVHGLKGSAMNLSATQLSKWCGQLEQQSRVGDLSQAERLMPLIELEYQQAKQALLSL